MRQRFDSRAIFAAVAAVVAVLAVVVIVTGLRYFSTIHELVVQADAIMPNDEAEGAVAPVVGRSWAPLAPGVASAAGGGFEAKGFLVNVEKAEVS